MTRKTLKLRKLLALVSCAVLLVCVTIAGTVAYLTAVTGAVTNTFTVGSVAIDLDETDVDVYGVEDGTTRVKTNTYKLIPGHSYVKDPIVHVTSGSEACYVFVKVVDEIAAIEDTATVAAQMEANGWVALNGAENVYYYESVVDARSAQQDLTVFTYFKLKGDAAVADYEGKTIKIDAYAVQADGFTSAAAAWDAANNAGWEF